MGSLRDTFDAFRRGEAGVPELIAAFDAAVAEDPGQCRALLDELGALSARGRFPPQVLSLLEAQAAETGAAPAAPGSGTDPDPNPDDDAATVVAPSAARHQPTPTAAADEEATVVAGAPPRPASIPGGDGETPEIPGNLGGMGADEPDDAQTHSATGFRLVRDIRG